jgi:biopolymer transport protein ExbD
MPIRFACSACKQVLKAPDKAAGRTVACPKCGEPLIIPAAESEQAFGDDARGGAVDHGDIVSVRSSLDDDALDMTPMVDVTFLLLIFFMVTAAFAVQKVMDIGRTEESASAAQSRSLEAFERDAIIVRIDRDNTYWVTSPSWANEREAPSSQEMLIQLRDARDSAGGPAPNRMLVMAHGGATHERVVAALDAGAEVGVEAVQLATFEDGDL